MIYAFGAFELDTRVFELRRAGIAIPLEPQVFDVLAYLIRHRDRLISKEELLEKLWSDRFVAETTLTSRLKEARKAVGDTGSEQAFIRTQRGRGYRFVATVTVREDPSGVESAPTPIPGALAPESSSGLTAATSIRFARDQAGFVGRTKELDALRAAFEAALADSRRVVFVTGEAGAGKTTLVDAFLSGVANSGTAMIARGQCVENRGSGEPYMPLLDALARLASQPDNTRLGGMLRGLAPSWLLQMPSLITGEEAAIVRMRAGQGGERMLREFGMLVDQLVAEIPLVLVLEDLHWSDFATLDAIDVLARQRPAGRLLLIGTWRPSDVKAARHPVYALTQELRAKGQCEVIPLPLFDAAELGSYLALRLGDERLGTRAAPALLARTGGNALFARNLVDSWFERGLFVKRDGRWGLSGDLRDLERDVPDTLQHLIENQISRLDPGSQRLLETAAVAGRRFSVALIAASLPAADDDVERQLENLARESSIVRADGSEPWGDGSLTSRFSFAHDLYVDVVYGRIPSMRRARLHRQLGLALERAWNGREKMRAPELALHFRRALDRQKGPAYLALAAEQALERSAHREAVEHLSAALELIEGEPGGQERKRTELKLRCRLAPSLITTRGWVEPLAEENYLRARQLAEELGDMELLSQALYGLANMYEYVGQYTRAEEVTKERIALDQMGSCDRVIESHELLTCSLLHQGRYTESVRVAEIALSSYRAREAKEFAPEVIALVVRAHGWMSGALHFAGRFDEALESNARALALSGGSGDQLARASAAVQSAFVRFHRREPRECSDLAARGEAISTEHLFPFHLAFARILRGWADCGTLGHEDAARQIQRGIRTCESIGARMDLPLFYAILADVLAAGRDARGALDALDTGIALVSHGRTFFYAPELYRQYGSTLSRLGEANRADAIAAIRRALEMAAEQGCRLFELRALVDLVTLDGAGWKPRLAGTLASFTQSLASADLEAARSALSGEAAGFA